MQSAITVVVDQRTTMLMDKYVSAGGGVAENRAAGLTARHCNVGLTLRHRRRYG